MRISKSHYWFCVHLFSPILLQSFEPVEITAVTMKVSNLLPLIALLLVTATASSIVGTVDSLDHATVGNTSSNEKDRILKKEKGAKGAKGTKGVKGTKGTESPSISSVPSSAPTCSSEDEVSVCIALDDSGSISDIDFEVGRAFARKSLQGIEDAEYAQVLKQYSVVVFASTAITIQELTEDVDAAKLALSNFQRVSGGTNTADAIIMCQTELDGQPNPVIVLITDGVPNSQQDAVNSATDAAIKGIGIIPVAINDDTSALEDLNALARCSGQANTAIPCEDNQGIDVSDFDGLDEIIRRLIVKINCNSNPTTTGISV
jgi:uncharacterized protein YegL